MKRILFARVGWMRWYKGPQVDDEKPVGGGKYNKGALGHEAYNFLPINHQMLAYLQPKQGPRNSTNRQRPHIALERIDPDSHGDVLDGVLTIFVATHPVLGKQRIVGWFKASTVHRFDQYSDHEERQSFAHFITAAKDAAVLVPPERRDFVIPGGKGAFGQANVCYALDHKGRPKLDAFWIDQALDYIDSYSLENAIQDPSSAADVEISGTVAGALEQSAGFQSNPFIRKAIESYAMDWANRYLTTRKYSPIDTHKNKPYDFVCKIEGTTVFVEVKGMQDDGQTISLTPREVEHAQSHENSALFIVHSVKVKGKRNPIISGGKFQFVYPWDISAGVLKPRSYVFTLSA